MPMFPIPVEGDVPPVLGVVFALAGLAVFVVLVWQTVRYFRSDRDDPNDRNDDGKPFR